MACQRVGMEPVEVLWNSSQKILSDMVGYIIIGGFSYEDRSRAGVIAALDIFAKASILGRSIQPGKTTLSKPANIFLIPFIFITILFYKI